METRVSLCQSYTTKHGFDVGRPCDFSFSELDDNCWERIQHWSPTVDTIVEALSPELRSSTKHNSFIRSGLFLNSEWCKVIDRGISYYLLFCQTSRVSFVEVDINRMAISPFVFRISSKFFYQALVASIRQRSVVYKIPFRP